MNARLLTLFIVALVLVLGLAVLLAHAAAPPGEDAVDQDARSNIRLISVSAHRIASLGLAAFVTTLANMLGIT
jgi:hypothetical protein